MKATEMLNKIKDVINPSEEVRLEQLKLENGTVLEAEKFASGNEVFILTEDTKVALPVGEYEMESGDMLKIEEEGIIADLGYEKKEYEDEKEEEEEKEDMNEEKYPTKDEFDALKKMVMDMKESMGKKEEMSNELPEEVVEELSQPAAEPIKHSPEVVNEKKKVLYSQNRSQTTMDRVLAMINKNK
jgi:hypothetical protein|tara:strand:+ start:124 stop:681 length:558 start_codon:yes stop_codon:yes gene_type:complete